MSYDVITIGSATRDVYLESDAFKSISSNKSITGKAIFLPVGSKIGVDNLHFATGGSAVNSSVTFANQGLKTAIVCKLGKDIRARALRHKFKKTGISLEYILYNHKILTAYSIIIRSSSGERTLLAYRGASSTISLAEVNLSKILKNTKWVFITHLGGESAVLFEPLIKEAVKHKVKIALNPGSTQLNLGGKLVPFLNYVDIFFVNQEEASILTDINFREKDKVFSKLDKWVKGIAVMTKGPNGVSVSDGKKVWDTPALKEPKFADRTGAGDAFASGFTSAIIKGQNIEDAIQLGSANATGVVGEWGANKGLLESEDSPLKFGKLKIKQT